MNIIFSSSFIMLFLCPILILIGYLLHSRFNWFEITINKLIYIGFVFIVWVIGLISLVFFGR